MSLQFRFPDYAWLVESMEFGQFLDLAFTNDSGEVWLFNNDLEVFLQHPTFSDLYLNRIAGYLSENIEAVRILVQPKLVNADIGLETSLRKNRTFCDRLAEIAGRPDGEDRLSTFYFGVAEGTKVPPQLDLNDAHDNWIFYAQRGDLDHGIVMLRHNYFPFQMSDDSQKFAIAWMLQHYPPLSTRLKKKFTNCFKTDQDFHKIEVISERPFDFRLVPASSHHRKNTPHRPRSVSLGDEVDVAIIAALPEEMSAIKDSIVPDEARAIPLHNEYEYVVLKGRTGLKKVLLTTTIDQGNIAAAIRTWDLIHKWRPSHIILVGVAGGDPNNKSQVLGDIVVGNWVVGYERGKIVGGDFKKDNSKHPADEVLLKAATDLKNGKRWPRDIEIERPSETMRSQCHVHDDLAFGSGSKLIADSEFFLQLQDIDRKIQAVEMEGDGVGTACDKARIKKVKVLVIKGIMDKSNKETRELDAELKIKWMRYAARSAAEFAIDVVREL